MLELIEYLKYSGPAGLMIVAGLVWGKKLIEYFFDESIELKKHGLNLEYEKYKAEIGVENRNFQHLLDSKLNELSIKHTKLHEERAIVIKELYRKLIELHSAMYDYTRRAHLIRENAEKEEDERVERVNQALSNYNNFYLPNKIYFTKEVASKLDELSKQYWDKGWDFTSSKQELKDAPREYISKLFESIRTISDIVEKDFTKLIEDLEDEFRLILGVI